MRFSNSSASPDVEPLDDDSSVPPPPLRDATIDDLRALDDKAKDKIIDAFTRGVPVTTLLQNLEETHGYRLQGPHILIEFYGEEARLHWQHAFETASVNADAILHTLRDSPFDYSEVLLKALGQQAFRMLTRRELDYKEVERFTRLLLQVRAQDNATARAKEQIKLQREKAEHQMKSSVEKGLNALLQEAQSNPEALRYFALFRAKLNTHLALEELELSKAEKSE